MERSIITTPTFRKKLNDICGFIETEFGRKTAFDFILRLDLQLNKVSTRPEIGRPLVTRKNVRSIILKPHSKIYYKIFPSRITLLSIIDMRQDPRKNPFN
ncbi:type II toxin-antitoxin system RelE/ParE family toxin [Segetibacter aerophilus]|uniref:type II toxin-antitoxin system RelE/ParE family toxin n=1 Tax=Segetibacter aerophilus TaxID=670293 RepID=UPI0011BD71C1